MRSLPLLAPLVLVGLFLVRLGLLPRDTAAAHAVPAGDIHDVPPGARRMSRLSDTREIDS
jgi:hypothetical protein